MFWPDDGLPHHSRPPADPLAETEGIGFGVSISLIIVSIDKLKELRPLNPATYAMEKTWGWAIREVRKEGPGVVVPSLPRITG